MRTEAKTSGPELLLGMIAIRLGMLVVVGCGLKLLPPQARDRDVACVPSSATRIEAQPAATKVGSRPADAVFDDMRLHD